MRKKGGAEIFGILHDEMTILCEVLKKKEVSGLKNKKNCGTILGNEKY